MINKQLIFSSLGALVVLGIMLLMLPFIMFTLSWVADGVYAVTEAYSSWAVGIIQYLGA